MKAGQVGAPGVGAGGEEASGPATRGRDGEDIERPPGPWAEELAERWRPESSEEVADYEVFRVRRDGLRHPEHGQPVHFHSVEVPPGVMVVPLTAEGGVVMVEQYRHAVRRVSLEFPAGMLDGDEDPEEAGPRELEEETGYRATGLVRLATVDPDPSLQSNSTSILLALGCEPTGTRHEDEQEEVRVRVVAEEEVPRLLEEGLIRHGVAVAAWGLYERWRATEVSDPA